MGDSKHTSQSQVTEHQAVPTLSQNPPAESVDSLGHVFAAACTFGGGDQPTEFTPPTIPGYELIREIGRGGMGVVFLARELALNRLVALKLVGGIASATDLARFRAEAEAVAALRHPNIVQIYAIGEAGGRPFVAFEYVEGGTLAQQLHGLPCNPHTAAALIVTLAEAMHFAHQQGIVHRDLKPSNVLAGQGGGEPIAPGESGLRRLRPQGLKIADFGLAKRLDQDESQTKTGLVMGTPEYMAPEQAAGQSRFIGPAADIYALGAVLYEMLTGRPPHRGVLPMDTLLQVLNDDPIRPRRLIPNLPRDLETICLKCLEKDPLRRYATAQSLADDLRRFLKDQPIQARPLGRLARGWRWCRRNRLAAAGLAAAGLSFLLGSAASLTFGLIALQRANEAEWARAAEREAKARAERQYGLTLATVDQLYPIAAALRQTQDVNEGRKQAILLAVLLYAQLHEEAPDDMELFGKLADLRLQLGIFYNELQQPTEALPLLDAARIGFEKLARREPQHYHYRYQEASSAYNRGRTLCELGQPREGMAQIELAISRWQAMLSSLPPKDVPRTIANAYLHLAHNALEEEELQTAHTALTQAEESEKLPPAPWERDTITNLMRSRRLYLQARLELLQRRPSAAVELLRESLRDRQTAEQENRPLQARPWERLALRLDLAQALSLAGDLPAARAELAEVLEGVQAQAITQSAFIAQTRLRVQALGLRARLEALNDPAAAAVTLAEAERDAADLSRAAPESVPILLEHVRILNDQLEESSTALSAAERRRLTALVNEAMGRMPTAAQSAGVQRERLRLAMATPRWGRAGSLAWTQWLPAETLGDLQLRAWSQRDEWSSADDQALESFLAEQNTAARAGDRLARLHIGAALVLTAQRHPDLRVASLRQAINLFEELCSSTPECWELQLRVAHAMELLAQATGSDADRAQAEKRRSALPSIAQRLLARWSEIAP
ncbi:MAG TPA: protein kinase [Gemmatales bacterium]|nr:protein kinase [Gemmatales bacterium]HMP61281.1 protein kinase [Gemmatales bacterium]